MLRRLLKSEINFRESGFSNQTRRADKLRIFRQRGSGFRVFAWLCGSFRVLVETALRVVASRARFGYQLAGARRELLASVER